MIGFGALAIRGVLFATVTDPYLLVAVQFFDGVTAAVFGVLIPLIVADIAFGSGHFNLAQGVVGTATGIGASLEQCPGGLCQRPSRPQRGVPRPVGDRMRRPVPDRAGDAGDETGVTAFYVASSTVLNSAGRITSSNSTSSE